MSLNPYVQFAGKVAAPDPAYPWGGARDVAVSGDGTGTPWKSLLLSDIWGLQQRLLQEAGITPNQVADSAVSSQYYDAIRRTAGFPGSVQKVFYNQDPSLLGVRQLLLDGSGVLVANYPDLVANTYVGDANNAAVAAAGGGFYKADDAAGTIPNTAGVYFILPDTRGSFPRGLDTAGAIDPDGASRYLGDIQGPAQADHFHSGIYTGIYESGDEIGVDSVLTSTVGPADDYLRTGGTPATVYTGYSLPLAGVPVPIETTDNRPSNFSCNFAIWY